MCVIDFENAITNIKKKEGLVSISERTSKKKKRLIVDRESPAQINTTRVILWRDETNFHGRHKDQKARARLP